MICTDPHVGRRYLLWLGLFHSPNERLRVNIFKNRNRLISYNSFKFKSTKSSAFRPIMKISMISIFNSSNRTTIKLLVSKLQDRFPSPVNNVYLINKVRWGGLNQPCYAHRLTWKGWVAKLYRVDLDTINIELHFRDHLQSSQRHFTWSHS